MNIRLTLAVLASISAGLLTGHLSAQEWSRFRGPNGSGVSMEADFPASLSRDGNAAWRTPVRPGKSSPVLSRRHVFTVAFDDGQFYTQCFDRASGRRLWERAEPRPRRAPAHRFNDAAAATPVTDGENVYVFFKDLGLISYDAAGERRWAVPLGPFHNNMGLAASPILADGLLILQIDQTSGSYLAAFDPATGKQAWKVARAEGDSWATPVHFTPADGPRAILTAGSGQFGAHAAKDGVRLWSQPGLSPALVASPVVVGDIAFVFGYGYEGPAPFGDALAKYDRNGDGMLQAEEFGEDAWLLQLSREEGDLESPVTLEEWIEAYRKITAPSSLLAIRLGKDEGAQSRILWRLERNFIGVVPSPLVLDGVVYIVRNGGILTSYDAETGRILKTGRLESAVGAYSASPVSAEGRIYLASEDGQVTIVQAGREWMVLGSSDLGEPVFATPALLAGRVYVRTASALYAFGK